MWVINDMNAIWLTIAIISGLITIDSEVHIHSNTIIIGIITHGLSLTIPSSSSRRTFCCRALHSDCSTVLLDFQSQLLLYNCFCNRLSVKGGSLGQFSQQQWIWRPSQQHHCLGDRKLWRNTERCKDSSVNDLSAALCSRVLHCISKHYTGGRFCIYFLSLGLVYSDFSPGSLVVCTVHLIMVIYIYIYMYICMYIYIYINITIVNVDYVSERMQPPMTGDGLYIPPNKKCWWQGDGLWHYFTHMLFGWWFGTCFIFHNILGIVIPPD